MILIIILMCNFFAGKESYNIGIKKNDYENKLSFLNYDPRTNMNATMKINGKKLKFSSVTKSDENEDGCNNWEEENVYMDPQYIWGKDFNPEVSKTLCESNVFVQGSKIKSIKYSERGYNMCVYVCRKQNSNILVGEGTKIELRDSYCTKILLDIPKCVCVLKYTCQELSYYIFLHIIANRHGDVALLYFESGLP